MANPCPQSFPTSRIVSDCPLTQQQWSIRAKRKKCWNIKTLCDKKNLKYHCLLNAYKNETVEVCVPRTRIPQDICPSYSFHGERVDAHINCSMLSGCPKSQYYSDMTYEYPLCLRKSTKDEDKSKTSTVPITTNNMTVADVLTPIIILLFITVAALIFYIVWTKKRQANQERQLTGDGEENELLSNQEEIRIVIFGETGVGKSSTGNTILDKDEELFCTSNTAHSVTQICQKGTKTLNNYTISVVDTPGYFDKSYTNKSQEKDMKHMKIYTKPGPHAILLVLPIQPNLPGTKAIKLIGRKFGKSIFNYCILVYTKEDALKNQGISLDRYLQNAKSEDIDIRRELRRREILFDNETKDQTYRKTKNEELLQMIENLKKENVSAGRRDHFVWKKDRMCCC